MFFLFWQGRLSASTKFTTTFKDLISLWAAVLRWPCWPDFVKFTAEIKKKKKRGTHLSSQPKNNTGANYFESDINRHIVQSYWQHKAPFNQRCHINWQRGFRSFKTVRFDTSSSFSDGFIKHSSGLERDPLLCRKSINWDATGEFLVVGTNRDSISSCTLFSSQVSKHAAMFRHTGVAGHTYLI